MDRRLVTRIVLIVLGRVWGQHNITVYLYLYTTQSISHRDYKKPLIIKML